MGVTISVLHELNLFQNSRPKAMLAKVGKKYINIALIGVCC